MALRKNQIGQGGTGRQVSRHRGDRPGRQSASLGASDVSTGSNMRVNDKGQLEVNKAQPVKKLAIDNEEDNDRRIELLVEGFNEIVEALQAAKLMRR